MSESPLGTLRLAQVAIVTHDIDKLSARFAKLLGVSVPKVIVTAPGQEVEMTYRGQPSDAQAKLAFFELENLQLELIEPMGGASVWQEALDKKGEHVHHLAFWVHGIKRPVQFLAAEGCPVTQRGDMNGGQYAYLGTDNFLGVALELLEKERTPLE